MVPPSYLAKLASVKLPSRSCVPISFAEAQCPDSRPTTKIALIGVGRWGTHLLRNLLDNPNAQVVAVADACEQQLNLASRTLKDKTVILTADWLEAMSVPGLEAVVIATPAATHHHLIRAALQKGLHVLSEKPLTLDIVDAIELCNLAEQQQRQLVVDHTYLFHPAVQKGQKILNKGAIGSPRYGYAARTHLGPVRNDVDALWDLAIHDIAIFNHWLNELPIKVQAKGKVWLQAQSPDSVRFPHGLSDLVWVHLSYPSGFQVSIHLCWMNPDKQRRLCIVGEKGTLVFDELNSDAPLILLKGKLEQSQNRFLPAEQQRHVFSIDQVEPLQAVCQHFLTCIHDNKTSSISSGWLGAELVQILAALTQSLHLDGQPISLSLQQA